MLADIKKDYSEVKTDKKSLRNFGIVFFVAFSLLGLFLRFRGKNWGLNLLPIGLLFLVLGITFERVLLPLYKAWMIFGIIMGWIVSRTVLFLLFFLVFTPINLLLKVMGKDILDQKIEKEKESYWNAYDENTEPDHYRNQF